MTLPEEKDIEKTELCKAIEEFEKSLVPKQHVEKVLLLKRVLTKKQLQEAQAIINQLG